MIYINDTTTVYDLITKYPEIKNIMLELGFNDIVRPGMLQSAGRVMNLNKGMRLKQLSVERMKEIFAQHGFELEIT